jgi:hypothetical protein
MIQPITVSKHGVVVFEVPPPPDNAPPQQWLDFATLLALVGVVVTSYLWNPEPIHDVVYKAAEAYKQKWP